MDLREVGYDDRDWINLAQDRDQWRAYVRAAMNLREHDFPDFLKGPLRETCQHIRVGHRKNSLQDVEEEEASPSPLESWKSPPQPDTASLATIPPVAAPRERQDHRRTFTPEPGAARDSPDIGALLQRVGSARPHIPRSRSSLAQYTQPAQHADVTRRAHSSLDKPR
ncbi:hypothetical protein ANN_00023 [Periplaneta americana]|uniref:Uncharacterized protein n=1 Tax=Periplaneta americana TaxID=6978 RepID=A0ABQ8TPL2_PERAM|nr:hypothetical protein ANN_00023 [Periplaneta americana]